MEPKRVGGTTVLLRRQQRPGRQNALSVCPSPQIQENNRKNAEISSAKEMVWATPTVAMVGPSDDRTGASRLSAARAIANYCQKMAICHVFQTRT
jgi:hypothetical protein